MSEHWTLDDRAQFATLLLAELTKFNPNHEPAGSPEGGQFAAGPGNGGDDSVSHVQSDPGADVPAGERTAERAKDVRVALETGGLSVPPASTLPLSIREQLHITDEDIGPALDAHVATARGMAKALDSLPPELANFKTLIRDKVKFYAVSYEPRSQMVTITGQGVAAIIMNTGFDPVPGMGRNIANSYSAKVADTLWHDGKKNEALEEMGRLSLIHEFGHVMDRSTGKEMTNSFINTLMLSGMSDPKKLVTFLKTKISPYAAASPAEASAEVFSMAVDRAHLPKELAEWSRHALGKKSASFSWRTKNAEADWTGESDWIDLPGPSPIDPENDWTREQRGEFFKALEAQLDVLTNQW